MTSQSSFEFLKEFFNNKEAIKLGIYKSIFRLIFGILITLSTLFIVYIFQISNLTILYITVLGCFLLFSIIYFFKIENLLIDESNDYYIKRLTIKELIFENKQLILTSIVPIIGLLGLFGAIFKNIEIHVFVTLFLLTSFIGISIRTTFHRLNISKLSNSDIVKHRNFLLMTVLIIILICTLLFIYNPDYLNIVMIGITFGILTRALYQFLQMNKFDNILISYQDNTLIDNIGYFNKKHDLYKPFNSYKEGNISKSIKFSNRIIRKKNGLELNDKEKIDLYFLLYRSYLRKGETKKSNQIRKIINNLVDDDQVHSYMNYLSYIYKLKDFDHAYTTLSEIVDKNFNDYSKIKPIVLLNLSHVLIKKGDFEKSKLIAASIIKNHKQLNPLLLIYTINNYCYSSVRAILINTNYFNILSSAKDKNSFFEYTSDQSKNLIDNLILLNHAEMINSRLNINLKNSNFKPYAVNDYVLTQTKSLIQFSIGNFDEAIELINPCLNHTLKRSSIFKLLAIYNAVKGNIKTAELNFREYKAIEEGFIHNEYKGNYEKDTELITLLINSFEGESMKVFLNYDFNIDSHNKIMAKELLLNHVLGDV